MSVRAWILIVAIGVSAPVSHAQEQIGPSLQEQPATAVDEGQADAALQDESGKYQEQPASVAPVLERIEAAIRDLISVEDEGARLRQQEQEIRDLHAQESMAFWAKYMFYATAVTVVLTAIALYAILRTLSYTRRAAEHTAAMVTEAQKTTAAGMLAVKQAENGNRIASESAAIGNRPWLSIDVSPDIHLENTSGNHIYATPQIVAKNIGKTPTTEITIDSFLFGGGTIEEENLAIESFISRNSAASSVPDHASVLPGETLVGWSSCRFDVVGNPPNSLLLLAGVFYKLGGAELKMTVALFTIGSEPNATNPYDVDGWNIRRLRGVRAT